MFEKVNPSHPDKLADRIAGALVDYAYTQEKDPKIAVEVLIGHGVCHIIVETSVRIPLDFVEKTVKRIAGDRVVSNFVECPQDPHLADNQAEEIRCGDNGIFKGMPVTDEQKQLSHIARKLYTLHPFDLKTDAGTSSGNHSDLYITTFNHNVLFVVISPATGTAVTNSAIVTSASHYTMDYTTSVTNGTLYLRGMNMYWGANSCAGKWYP